jgi:hypothetical protein
MPALGSLRAHLLLGRGDLWAAFLAEARPLLAATATRCAGEGRAGQGQEGVGSGRPAHATRRARGTLPPAVESPFHLMSTRPSASAPPWANLLHASSCAARVRAQPPASSPSIAPRCRPGSVDAELAGALGRAAARSSAEADPSLPAFRLRCLPEAEAEAAFQVGPASAAARAGCAPVKKK